MQLNFDTRYLVVGYGNIAKTLISIIESMGEKWNIEICDIKDGGKTGQEVIEERHQDFDVIVNLTYVDVAPFKALCDKYGLTYIDAGYEYPENCEDTWHELFIEAQKDKKGSKHFLGFGMNPGIAEFLTAVYGPDRPHIACQFETDKPVVDENVLNSNEVFATWSPYTYFVEAALTDAYVSTKKEPYMRLTKEERYDIELTGNGETHVYCIVPHEEVLNMTKDNPYCEGSAFIFHAPTKLQNFAKDNYKDYSKLDYVNNIPVLHDIGGTESVGIIFYDGSDNIRYVVNTVDHAESFKKYGHNATCWQTACGVYIGMCMAQMVPEDTSWTLSKAAYVYKKEVQEILDKLGFKVEEIDHFMKKEEFEEKILPLFKGNTSF